MTIDAVVLLQREWTILMIRRNREIPASDYLDALPARARDKALRLLVAENGRPRNVHQNRKLDRDIWELKSDQTRLLYFTEGPRVIILTHGFLKKQQKLPRRELERARRLRDQYLLERQP